MYARIPVHLLNSNSYLYQVFIFVYDFNAKLKCNNWYYSLGPVWAGNKTFQYILF
jgi:hypothetical protein